jgi:hypothetical protein
MGAYKANQQAPELAEAKHQTERMYTLENEALLYK